MAARKKSEEPYFDAWRRRTSRQLAQSGRVTQLATILSKEQSGSVEEWRKRLIALQIGGWTPPLDVLTRIDSLLAAPQKSTQNGGDQAEQGLLF